MNAASAANPSKAAVLIRRAPSRSEVSGGAAMMRRRAVRCALAARLGGGTPRVRAARGGFLFVLVVGRGAVLACGEALLEERGEVDHLGLAGALRLRHFLHVAGG